MDGLVFAAVFHEFVLGLVSGRPPVLAPAILLGAAALDFTCVLDLLARWDYIDL